MTKIAEHIAINPFPGLRAFRTDDTHLFFGREGQIDEVMGKLEENRFVATLGTSGSGKSSLMYCGLIPNLHGGFMTEAGSNWRVVVSRPGISPINNLADALTTSDSRFKHLDREEQLVKKKFGQAVLRSSSLGIVEFVKHLQAEADENFLIMIDQFEELFRFNRLEDDNYSVNESAAFVKLMMQAIKAEDLPIYVVLTMRSDYLGDCAQFSELTSMINDSHYLIPQMTRSQKRSAILGPVAVGRGDIAPRLVQQILNDLGDSSDQLPIMQHALMRTWDFWQKNRRSQDEPMDVFHYESVGRMAEALSMHANEAYEELNKREKEICADLFKVLTEKSNDGRGIRRPTRLSEIAAIAKAEPQEVIEVIEHFRMPGRTFLMPPTNISLTETSVIDISHESLMRVWARCKNWVEEEFESVKIYKRLCEASNMYQIGKTSLWRPPDLQLAINWQAKQQPNLVWAQRYDPAFERAIVFLETSRKTYEEEQRSKDRIQKRQLRIIKTVAVVIGIFSVGMIMLAIYANLQSDQARRSAEEAQRQKEKIEEQNLQLADAVDKAEKQRQKAEEAAEEAERQRKKADDALVMAREAEAEARRQQSIAQNARDDALQQRQKALEAAEEAKRQEKYANQQAALAEQQEQEAKRQQELAERLRYLSIAQTMAVKSQKVKDTTLRALVALQAYNFNERYEGSKYNPDIYDGLYNAEKALEGENWNVMMAHNDVVRAITFDPITKKLYSASSEGTILQWDFSAKDRDYAVYSRSNFVYRDLAISVTGRWMAVGTNENDAKLFDLTNGEKDNRTLKKHESQVWAMTFLPGTESLVTVGADNTLVLWNALLDFEPQVIARTNARIKAVTTNAEGTLIIGALEDGKILVWDVNKNFNQSTIHQEAGDIATAIAVSPNKPLIAIGFESGKVIVWNMAESKQESNQDGHDARIVDIVFSADGLFMASASLDGSSRVWQVDSLNEQPLVLQDHSSWVTAICFSLESDFVITGTREGDIKVYPLRIEDMAERICNNSRLERSSLTEEEWENFVGKDINIETTCGP